MKVKPNIYCIYLTHYVKKSSFNSILYVFFCTLLCISPPSLPIYVNKHLCTPEIHTVLFQYLQNMHIFDTKVKTCYIVYLPTYALNSRSYSWLIHVGREDMRREAIAALYPLYSVHCCGLHIFHVDGYIFSCLYINIGVGRSNEGPSVSEINDTVLGCRPAGSFQYRIARTKHYIIATVRSVCTDIVYLG